MFAGLLAANAAAWAWAYLAFGNHPAVLTMAVIAYGFGLRHAVDADHIAAIDNVTRKLMQEGHRPVATGLFFSLGHSTVVVVASLCVALTAATLQDRFAQFRVFGGVFGTLVSGFFLLVIAAVNLVVLADLWGRLRAARAGRDDPALAERAAPGGLLARLLRPAFRLITRSWQMYPLGVLFGLGFDTATEVGLLGMSAAGAVKGLPIWSILVFPALFTAGMSLVDSMDSVLMVGAYGWAFVRPQRKLVYNSIITLLSALFASVIGGIEILGLFGSRSALHGVFWKFVGWGNEHLDQFGLVVTGFFLVGWGGSVLFSRWRTGTEKSLLF